MSPHRLLGFVANPIFKPLEGVKEIKSCKWEIRGQN